MINKAGTVRAVKSLAIKLGLRRIKTTYGIKTKKLEGFFEELDRKNIRYVVLRWFDSLPNIGKGNDIDLLVDDDSFFKVRRVAKGARRNGNFTILDIYSVSNLVANYSYYSPRLGKRILDNRVINEKNIWIPDPENYFFSLAYHVLFHKGFNSGVRSCYRSERTEINTKHDYVATLLALAKKANIKFPMPATMEGIEQVLKDNDWLPPLDVYFRRSKTNRWVYCRVQDVLPDRWKKNKGLAVFIVRDKAVGIIKELLKVKIKSSGASVIREVTLTDEQAERFMEETRGGDWGIRSVQKSNAGLARLVIVASMKETDEDDTYETAPQGVVEYEWVKRIKREVRDVYTNKISITKKYHIMHTSDNGVEASCYVNVLDKVENRI